MVTDNSEGITVRCLPRREDNGWFPMLTSSTNWRRGQESAWTEVCRRCVINGFRRTGSKVISGIWISISEMPWKGWKRVARFIFENYPCPLWRVALNAHPKNQIESIQFLPLNRLDDEEQDFFANTLDNFNKKIWRAPKSAKPRYSLAVLIDPKEKFPPSNKGALHKLSEVAKKMNIHVEMITEDDAMRLLNLMRCLSGQRHRWIIIHSICHSWGRPEWDGRHWWSVVYHSVYQ